MPGQDCLAAALAATVPPAPLVTPVAYTIARIEHAPDAAKVTPRARGPPRPFGQGRPPRFS